MILRSQPAPSVAPTPWPTASPAPLALQVLFADDHVVVAVGGDVDMSAWPSLDGVRAQLARHGVGVVLDAARVTFLDCEGLQALLSLVPPGQQVRVCQPSRCVRLLLTAAGRTDLLVEEAPTSWAQGPLVRVESQHTRTGTAWWPGVAGPRLA